MCRSQQTGAMWGPYSGYDRADPISREVFRRGAQHADATFGILRPDAGRDVLRHIGRPAGATGGGQEQGPGGSSRSESGDDLRPVQRRANQPSRTAKSSMISALTLLRTLFYGRSSHTNWAATRHRADCGRLRARRRRRARLASSASPEAQDGLPVVLPGSTQPQPLFDGEEESPAAPLVAPPAA